MRFVLEVDLPDDDSETAAAELGRVLRHWGGSVGQVELAPGAGSDVHDSAYRRVGSWSVAASE